MWNKIKSIDQKILEWLNHLANKGHFWPAIIKIFSEYTVYLGVLVIIVLWFWQASAKKVALRAFFSGLLAWQVLARLISYFVNRARPFELTNVKEIIFHRPTYSFPSDHAAALFAVAFSLWFSKYKKLSIFFFILATLMSVGRVAAGLHWPSDVLGGLVVGLMAAWLVWIFDKPLNYIYTFLIGLARKIKLA